MFFCPLCTNILYIDKPNTITTFFCNSCPYQFKISNTLSKTMNNRVMEIDKILGEDEYKYASTCNKNCIKCDSDKALFMELQTRSADEPMTIFYECIKCKANWKEN
ncbi:rna polymerase iii subunit c11 [Vairimorpha apis BRL 01]|uniref:DNA-directed RNA polymerase subunit n=1 Tax=Vairimorpha apis BRL 01 TaxID=1037528 RepID=T0L8N8_9MICR|nr:rna polymerase iii subunit c11 [Vairimorpha apis BRL 01]